jgi:hypothetical protein
MYCISFLNIIIRIKNIFFLLKWKTQRNYHTVGTIPKSNIKIVERDTIDTPSTQIYMTRHFNVAELN